MEPLIEQIRARPEKSTPKASGDGSPVSKTCEPRLMKTEGRFLLLAALLVLMHAGFMLFRYGELPVAPYVGDEIVIQDAAISLARGHGYVATSFADSRLGMDHVFAHFPPVYPLVAAAVFRIFGVSVYTMRLTTTVMSIASTILLAALLLYLCRAGLLSRQVALIVLAIDCSTGSLISLDRLARMESMLSLLVLLATFSLFVAILRGAKGRIFWPALTTVAAMAMCLAVHPEAITALVLLAGIGLFAIHSTLKAKLAALGATVLIPVLLLIAFFGKQSVTAVRQFLVIFSHRIPDMTIREWISQIFHPRNVSLARDTFLMLEIVVLFTVPMVCWAASKGWTKADTPRHRVLTGFCFAALVEWVMFLSFMKAGAHRYQFLFGPLLLLNAFCIYGARPLRRWEARAAWAFIALNIVATLAYVCYPRFGPADRNPERYRAVLKRIPPNVRLAVTPALWLDMEEENRPYSLLYWGMDGEDEWEREWGDPLRPFDAIVIVEADAEMVPWDEQASRGRHKYVFKVGTQNVAVYLRDGIQLAP